MKKNHLLIVIAILLFFFGLYIYFNPPGKPKEITKIEKIYVDTSFGKRDTIFITPNNSNQVCVECADETVGQEVNHFRNVIKNYRTNIWDIINESPSTFSTTTKNLNGSKYFGGYPKNNLILNGSYELDYDLTVTGTLGGIDTIRLVDENDSAGSARYFVITGAGGNYKYRNIITVNLFNAQILFSGSFGEIANGYIRLKKINKTFI